MTRRSVTAVALIAGLSMASVFVMWQRTPRAQAVSQRLEQIDSLVGRIRHVENRFPLRAIGSSSAGRLGTLAQRWPAIRAMVERRLGPGLVPETVMDAGVRTARARNPAVSAPNLSLTRFSGFTQNETATAWCGTNVVVGFNDTAAEVETLAATTSGVSLDGYSVSSHRGAGFRYRGPLPPASDPNTMLNGDPSLACTSADDFYYSSLWFDATNKLVGVALSLSTDGGNDFSAPQPVVAKDYLTHFIDWDRLVLDPSHPDLIYLTYTDFDTTGAFCGLDSDGDAILESSIQVVSSTDAGATWSAPSVIAPTCATNHATDESDSLYPVVHDSSVAVGPDGEIYVAWEAIAGDGVSREIDFASSAAGSQNFSTPVTVHSADCAGGCGDLQGYIRIAEAPELAVDTSRKSSRGTIYVAWTDGDDAVPDSLSGSYAFTDILLSSSTDGGANWSSPLRADNSTGAARPGVPVDHFEPAIAVDRTGRVAVCFYDRRRDPNNFFIDRYCASSKNRGVTWSNRRITAQSFPSLVAQDLLDPVDYMGDYDTLAADFLNITAGFRGAYGDNSSGNPEVRINSF